MNNDFNSSTPSSTPVPPPPLPKASELPSTGEIPVVGAKNSGENAVKISNVDANDNSANDNLAGYVNREKPSVEDEIKSIKRRDLRKEHSHSVLTTFFKDLVIIVAVAVVLTVVLKAFVIEPFIIPSESMRDTLMVNDRIMTFKLKPTLFGLKRGDVVVFKDEEGWLPASLKESEKLEDNFTNNTLKHLGLLPDTDDSYLVKRLIGLPGDHVQCSGRGLPIVINGVAINNEPYLKEGVAPSDIPFDVQVPEGSIFVMGDNRANSSDSRYNTDKPGNGFVKEDSVVGVAFLKYWPQNRFHLIDDESTIFDEVSN